MKIKLRKEDCILLDLDGENYRLAPMVSPPLHSTYMFDFLLCQPVFEMILGFEISKDNVVDFGEEYEHPFIENKSIKEFMGFTLDLDKDRFSLFFHILMRLRKPKSISDEAFNEALKDLPLDDDQISEYKKFWETQEKFSKDPIWGGMSLW